MIPLIAWAQREVRNAKVVYLLFLVYGKMPWRPYTVLKASIVQQNLIHSNLGRKATKYLNGLQQNLSQAMKFAGSMCPSSIRSQKRSLLNQKKL